MSLVSVSFSHRNDCYYSLLFSRWYPNQRAVIVIPIFSSNLATWGWRSDSAAIRQASCHFHQQWTVTAVTSVTHSPSSLPVTAFPPPFFFSTSSSLSRLANILMPLRPGSLSTLPSADNADWQVKPCAAEREGRAMQRRRAEGRERRLLGFLLALMWAKQMNDIVIQGVKPKNKDSEERKISDWRTVRIKAMPWIWFSVAERQATAWPWNYEVLHLVKNFPICMKCCHSFRRARI